MIQIKEKINCSGCGACEQVCPQHCISLVPDSEGYWYPSIDVSLCVECHLCERACPVINSDQERVPKKVFAANNKDEIIRSISSSGGVFTIIAEKVIDEGGVVFGVKFDENWNTVFDYTESKKELEVFRRSKYVQAWLGDTYKKVRQFLANNRLVLFVGTPCQVAGLRHFLKKDYNNLLLMDLICEGVPSPKVWKKYLHEEFNRQVEKYHIANPDMSINDMEIKGISFRNKLLGWKQFSFSFVVGLRESKDILFSYADRNSAYLQAMFQYLDLRPICYECPFKCCKSQSDITIADYWGISVLHPEIDDDKGTSMVYLNSHKGECYFDVSKTNYIETNYEEAFLYNNIVTSSKRHPYRDKFFARIDEDTSIIHLLRVYTYTKTFRMKRCIKKTIKFFLPKWAYCVLKSFWNKIK